MGRRRANEKRKEGKTRKELQVVGDGCGERCKRGKENGYKMPLAHLILHLPCLSTSIFYHLFFNSGSIILLYLCPAHTSSFKDSSVTQLCPTLCDPMSHNTQASLSITNSQSPPKPMSIESVIPSNLSIWVTSEH
ncbi:hypothetical protein MG293_000905 [Ovis ammon polii]|uniref:Uncharacterized protein n=1 Tax=Ovis ammon polii TaxID=230172 RepID=A0AAD4YF21_OVIAM|nr:hypothetical protein MG293_000905 [Ovis ammon polii]